MIPNLVQYVFKEIVVFFYLYECQNTKDVKKSASIFNALHES